MSNLAFYQGKLKLSKLPQQILLTTVLTITTLTVNGLVGAQAVSADYSSQINQLRQENRQNAANQKNLTAQEENISTKIANLQTNIQTIESAISRNRAKNVQLEASIAEAEKKIANQRRLLGVNLRQLYLDDQMSTLEKLASSRGLSEYVDKEQYRISVQHKIKTTMERIEELKREQEEQKATIIKLLSDQKSMQAQLAAQKAENERLRNLNRQQQESYSEEISTNNERIAELQRQQAIENARHRVSASPGAASSAVNYVNGGGYPYAHHPFPNTIVDPWGMYTRQCVSYTAWKVAASGRHMPYWGGRGNANQWDDNARMAGIPVDTNPRTGDVAVSNAGYYGHVMYVEAVHGDGTITISDYNVNWDGRYSEYRRTTAGLVFIHF